MHGSISTEGCCHDNRVQLLRDIAWLARIKQDANLSPVPEGPVHRLVSDTDGCNALCRRRLSDEAGGASYSRKERQDRHKQQVCNPAKDRL